MDAPARGLAEPAEVRRRAPAAGLEASLEAMAAVADRRDRRRPYPHPSQYLRARWEYARPAAKASGHAGNRRLHERWLTYLDRKKRPVIANVAIAREPVLRLTLPRQMDEHGETRRAVDQSRDC